MSYVPQTQIWPDDPYIPGSLQCDVLTRQGLNCGNVIGQGRCYEYCQRLATHWEGKLLPLAIKMAMFNDAQVYDGYTFQPSQRPTLFYWNLPATTVIINLLCLRDRQVVHRSNIFIDPNVEDCELYFTIPLMADVDNGYFLNQLRNWIQKFCPETQLTLSPDTNTVSFFMTLPQNSTVGTIVNLALQVLLMNAVRFMPFTMMLEYGLPQISIDGVKGVRIRNTQAIRPAYDLDPFY
jgi:hypothetical protein